MREAFRAPAAGRDRHARLTLVLETCLVASTSSASRSPAIATPATASATRPPADVTAITTRDDFLLELGELLSGRAAVHPVDSLEAALARLTAARRAQVLVIDSRGITDVRAAVEAAHASPARPAVLVFVEGEAEKRLGRTLASREICALLPLPLEMPRTQVALEAAIAHAAARSSALAAAVSAAADAGIGAPRPLPPEPPEPAAARTFRSPRLIGAGAGALVLVAAGTFWYLDHAGRAAAPGSAAPAATSSAGAKSLPVAGTSLAQRKLDELLEKARLAMHERRFSEPAGDNALLYYRSATAADPGNAEARDGLQRVAAALAARFEEALNGAHLDEAAATLASFKSAAPGDARVTAFEQRLYSAQLARALADGNFDRAASLVHQAQQSGAIAPEQIARWRAEIVRHEEEAKVQRLAGLIEDRIREGRLVEADDSARVYLEQLQSAAPAHAATQRAVHELVGACLRRAREAGLAKNGAEEERWVAAARIAGARAADLSAFQKDLAAARAKAAQTESQRLLQLARERLHEGHLTDPASDCAAAYLTQLQASDPANPALADAGHELAKALLDRARAAVLAGKPADADLAQAKHWGAEAKELAAAQQPQSGAAPGAAALASNLKRLRSAPPDYPANALEQRIAGSVLLEFTVDTRGETRDIHVLESTPAHVFDQAAISAVKRWLFAPMIVNGAAVEVPVKTRIRFELPK